MSARSSAADAALPEFRKTVFPCRSFVAILGYMSLAKRRMMISSIVCAMEQKFLSVNALVAPAVRSFGTTGISSAVAPMSRSRVTRSA